MPKIVKGVMRHDPLDNFGTEGSRKQGDEFLCTGHIDRHQLEGRCIEMCIY